MSTNIDPNNKDFQFSQQGFLLPAQQAIIYDQINGEAVWNNDAYEFMQTDCPDTANKLLWRQGQLCSTTAGLYQVVDGIYQVRNFDLANMTIVRVPNNTNQVVIIDCLSGRETANAALDLYQQYHSQQMGQQAEIVALIYTHCHVDHFGGAQAVLAMAGRGADLPIYAPEGFLEHAVSENVYAGVAMARRAVYMYGESLDKSPTGQIGCGLGQSVSTGIGDIIGPKHNVKVDGPLIPEISGLEIHCQLTPGTEAPAEMNFFFPQYSALCAAENATHTLHNIQTLRGAPVRDSRVWSRYLDETIALWGDKATVVFASHHWPTWNQDGENLVAKFLSEQRDYYAYLNNETLRQLNLGSTPVEIGENIVMPPELSTRTNLQGYYGSINHNAKAVYDKYMGWFDGNPANLWKWPPAEEAARYVNSMGGRAAALQQANNYVAANDLRFAATLLNHLVFQDPTQDDAKKLLSQVYTKLGYGAENGTWRNIYLVGAQELLTGPNSLVNTMTSAFLMSLSLDELFDTMAIRINGPEAHKQKGGTVNFMVTDMNSGKKPNAGWHLRLSHSALTGRQIPFAANPDTGSMVSDLTVWLNHEELASLVGVAADGKKPTLDKLTVSGDTKVWDTIVGLIQVPSKNWNIVTP